MAGLGYLRNKRRPDRPDDDAPAHEQQPFAVDLDSVDRPRPLWSWLALVVAALAVFVAARPLASSFPTEVALRRSKRPPQNLLQQELRAFAAAPRRALLDKATVSRRWEWPDEPGLWSRDLLLFSTGCTPKACFVGVAGRWWRAPRWKPRFELYALFALHGVSLLCSHQAPGLFFAHFAPRVSHPQTLVLGAFACVSPWSLLWLGAIASSLGEQLQHRLMLGRLGTLGLYLACGLASSAASALFRRSATGAGGLLGALAYHALAAPRATHSFFGLELSAHAGFAAQFLFASWGGLNQPGQAVPTLVVNGLPAVLGAAWFFAAAG